MADEPIGSRFFAPRAAEGELDSEESMELYNPNYSFPEEWQGVAYWLQEELGRIGAAMVTADFRLLALLTNPDTGRLRDWIHWAGHWQNGFYRFNDMVFDNGWTAIVINPDGTTDRPSPIPIGDPIAVYQGANPTTSDIAKQVLSGNRYTWTVSGYLLSYRIYTIAGNHYTVISVDDPLGTPIFTQLVDFTAENTGWATFDLGARIILQGTVMDLVVNVNEPDPTPVTFNGNWNYQTPQNNGVPGIGDMLHSRGLPGVFNVNKIDNDLVDRAAELAVLTIGDIIDGAGLRWTIQSITDAGSYIAFGVSPAANGVIGVSNFVFETVIATPITYMEDVNYWPGTPFAGTIQGLISVDGNWEGATVNDNAYGTDITIQEGSASPDWQLVATSTGGSGGGSDPEKLSIDGSIPMEGNLDMNANRITLVAAANADDDAVSRAYGDTRFLQKATVDSDDIICGGGVWTIANGLETSFGLDTFVRTGAGAFEVRINGATALGIIRAYGGGAVNLGLSVGAMSIGPNIVNTSQYVRLTCVQTTSPTVGVDPVYLNFFIAMKRIGA